MYVGSVCMCLCLCMSFCICRKGENITAFFTICMAATRIEPQYREKTNPIDSGCEVIGSRNSEYFLLSKNG